jgi:hypothetical protein
MDMDIWKGHGHSDMCMTPVRHLDLDIWTPGHLHISGRVHFTVVLVVVACSLPGKPPLGSFGTFAFNSSSCSFSLHLLGVLPSECIRSTHFSVMIERGEFNHLWDLGSGHVPSPVLPE